MIHKFDQVNVSAVAMLNHNTAVVGTFEGGLCTVDLRENHSVCETRKMKLTLMRPHVDAVMSIATHSANEFIFATNARKDSYTYVWDCRKYDNTSSSIYLSEFLLPKNHNQRINLSFGS
jgi:hypothetical protein